MESTLACDLCRSVHGKLVLRGTDHREGLGGDFAIQKCRQCGLARTDPRPDNLLAWYPASYQQHVASDGLTTSVVAWAISRVASRRLPRTIRAALEWLIPDAALGDPLPPGARVLDVGAGNGTAVRALAAVGIDAHGIEPSADAVAAARSRGCTTVTQGTLDDTRLQPGDWDVIRMSQVLEHVPSPRTTLETIRPALKPDGVVVIGVPNFASALRWLTGPSWDGLELPRHLHHFTPATLGMLLESTGFEVVTMRTVALFGVLPATIDAWLRKGRSQRGWRNNLWLRVTLYPVELVLALLHLGDGIVAVGRPGDTHDTR